ncbi:hypothetical protein BV898_05710 [Hypsibius exemplaris]|uniref:Uncharacterized protein n=1 Tax=Hypsibius exemplaris TaxID=2072580 RepID=A0A1W0WYZ1_HYPEX|nr:hypothetical protein BV898_05710 [Hypsibius exemplaris]
MFHRQTLATSQFCFEDCQKRWFRKFTGPDIEFMRSGLFTMTEQEVEDAEVEFGLAVRHQAMPKERRHIEALVIAKDMATIVPAYGGEGFQQRLAVLAKMLKLLKNNLKPGVLHLWLDRA